MTMKTMKIGDLTSKIGSGVTPRGGEKVYQSEGTALIRSQNVYDYRFVRDGLVFIDEDEATKMRGVEIFRDDVLINITGDSVGRCCIVPDDVIPARVNQHVCILRTDQFLLNPRYLMYVLNEPTNKNRLLNQAHGGTRKALTKGILESFDMKVPPLEVQEQIAEILGSLDDKIELNRRMNETLEQMAMALYKHWFFYFGPFQDGEFVEIGEEAIPEGWTFKRLDEVAAINERSIGKKYPFNQIEYIDISSVGTGVLDGTTTYMLDRAPSRAKRLVFSRDIIWSTVRPNRKSYLYIHKPTENTVASTGFAVITPKTVPPSFLYCHVTTDEFVDYLVSNAEGSAYPAVRPDVFARAKVCVPPENVLASFDEKVGSLILHMQENMIENKQLQETRDYLLPRLLSGEIEVKAAEELIEEVLAGG